MYSLFTSRCNDIHELCQHAGCELPELYARVKGSRVCCFRLYNTPDFLISWHRLYSHGDLFTCFVYSCIISGVIGSSFFENLTFSLLPALFSPVLLWSFCPHTYTDSLYSQSLRRWVDEEGRGGRLWLCGWLVIRNAENNTHSNHHMQSAISHTVWLSLADDGGMLESGVYAVWWESSVVGKQPPVQDTLKIPSNKWSVLFCSG